MRRQRHSFRQRGVVHYYPWGIFSDAVALGISTNAVFFGGKRRKHLKLRIYLQRKCFRVNVTKDLPLVNLKPLR